MHKKWFFIPRTHTYKWMVVCCKLEKKTVDFSVLFQVYWHLYGKRRRDKVLCGLAASLYTNALQRGVAWERKKNTPLKFFNYVNGAKSIEQRQLLHWFPATLVHNTPPTEHWAKLPSRRAPYFYIFLTVNIRKLDIIEVDPVTQI